MSFSQRRLQVLPKMHPANHDRHAPGFLRQVLCLWLAFAVASPLTLPHVAHAQTAKQKKAAERKAAADKKAADKKAADKKAAQAEELKRARQRATAPVPSTEPKTTQAAPAKPGAAQAEMTPGAPLAPGAAGQEIKPFETGLPYEPTSPRSQVTFNLEDASLTDLVRLISQITGKRFILPGTTRAIKATVYAPTKVTAAEAYQAFMSILELNGMALVPAGRYLKIVESGRVEGRPIPLFTQDESVPEGDRYITRLQRVTNISAEDAASLIERFKSGDGSITAYAPTNMLIITDTGTNIRRMVRILDVIDVASTGEQIWVEPVHNATAQDIADRLSDIFEPAAGGGKSASTKKPAAKPAGKGQPTSTPTETIGARSGESLTKILADERTNSLIIVATERSYLRILEMLKYLDVSMEGGGKIHVHHLQHSDAEELANTLQALISGRGAGGQAARGGRGGQAAAGNAGGATADVFEGSVAITANKGTNALVITSSAHDYAALRPVIDLLDSARKQVFIEAVIMELSVDRNNQFGVAYHTGIPDVPAKDSVSVLGFRAQNTVGGLAGMAANGDTLSGLAVGVQGPVIANSQQLVGLSLPGFGVAVNALASSGDANILSTPHLIATDNVQAEISVGQNVPLQTSGVASLGGLGALGALGGLAGGTNATSAQGALGALGGLGGLGGFGAVPRQDVGTTVQITPHINESDEIRLEIQQEISSAGAPSKDGALGVVSIDRTRAKTQVVVRDQQTVVIGGLMRDQVTTADTKVPVLGDIPLIGALFKSSSKRKIKKNLLLFLTPYIIRSPDDLRAIYDRKMRERQEFLDRYFVFNDSEYAPPVDYSRTRGLVGEIMNELKALDEKNKLLAEASQHPELKHDPKPPVGSAPEGAHTGDEVIEPDGSVSPVEGAQPGGAPEGAPAPSPEAGPVPPPAEAPAEVPIEGPD
jgi:general secretion pathway protein D